jgi:hypothetical protein
MVLGFPRMRCAMEDELGVKISAAFREENVNARRRMSVCVANCKVPERSDVSRS